ncbi:MAG: hypothetical protein WEC80_02710 [Patescibacteria group bacterium]
MSSTDGKETLDRTRQVLFKNLVSSFLRQSRTVSVIFIIFVLFFISKASFAQQIGLSVSPPHLEAVIKPGKSILIAYQIRNFGDPTILKSNVFSFAPKGNRGEVDILEEFQGPVRFELDNSNLSLGQSYFLNTNQDQQLLLRIRIPEGAPEGDYYYTFISETVPNPAIEGLSSSQARGKIGTNILITVTESGRIDLKGQIAIFDVLSRYSFNLFGKKYRVFDSGDIIPIVLTAENKGKNLIKPNGDIVLRGNFGEKAVYNVIPQTILAESQRELIATPSAEINCDQGRQSFYCKRDASLLISGFFLGKYDLSTTLNFGEGSPNVYSTVDFIALPIKFLVGLIIVILSTLIVLRAKKDKKKE